MFVNTPDISVPARKLEELLGDPEKSALVIKLMYVNDSQPGIRRIRKGKSFVYYNGKRRITDEDELLRIRRLVIPPAWERVWICAQENGHLQATGIDARGRKQYRYHQAWNQFRNSTKFYRLYEFGKKIPAIRERINRDLSLPGLPVEKVLAAVVSLMQLTSIRVGNASYEKLYGSFGITTLKDKHVKIQGASMQFAFRGKKGVAHNISLRSARLARIVKQCRDIPGKELFQYVAEDGTFRCIDSGMVNDYIQEIAGEDFTAKDFRTWTGSSHALAAFARLSGDEEKSRRQITNEVLDIVAKHLGNTRAVCKKYYVHPCLLQRFEDGELLRHLRTASGTTRTENCNSLGVEEQLLMKILALEKKTVENNSQRPKPQRRAKRMITVRSRV